MNFILVLLTAIFQIVFKRKPEYFYHPKVGITMADGGKKK